MTTERERALVYYTALHNAWFEAKNTLDSILLTISIGIIGWLILRADAMVSAKDYHFGELSCYLLSIFAFLIAIWNSIQIPGKNANYMEKLVKNKNNPSSKIDVSNDEEILGSLDTWLMRSFGSGVFLAIVGYLNGLYLRVEPIATSQLIKQAWIVKLIEFFHKG